MTDETQAPGVMYALPQHVAPFKIGGKGPLLTYGTQDLLARVYLNPAFHEAMMAWKWMRARYSCIRCGAVGTFKPHGNRAAQRAGDRPVRRWLCKWCGLYVGPEGWLDCVVNHEAGYWDLPWNVDAQLTPQRVIAESEIPNVNPWRG